MKDNEEKVEIDQLELLDQATAFGLFCRVISDFLPLDSTDEEKGAIGLLVGTLMIRPHLGSDGFKATAVAMADAKANRAVLSGSKGEVRWPLWDPDDHFEEDCHPLCDVFFAYYSYFLYSKKKVTLPDYSLGAIFTFSGVVLEGIARGYHAEDENMKELYPSFQEFIEKSFGRKEGTGVQLQSALQALNILVEARRKVAAA